MYDAFKLKAGNYESIWHGWYPSHITVMNDTGEPAVPLIIMMVFLLLYIYFYGFTYLFFKFKLTKKLLKQEKIRFFDITANFEY